MKLVLLLFVVISLAAIGAQIIKNQISPIIINSKILGEPRKILIGLPAGFNKDDPDKKRYPVVYLLDGDIHFNSVASQIRQLSEINGNTACPQMIIVAIPNTDRARDLTPSNYLFGPLGENIADFKSSGGSEKFIGFIEKELMPWVDSSYPTMPHNILIGHSLGGLTAMNMLLYHTALFNAYIVVDPSIWWDDQKLLTDARKLLTQKNFAGTSLFLAIANSMPPEIDFEKVREDTSNETFHIRSILELTEILKSYPANGLKWDYKYYHNDNHGSILNKAVYDALQFLFSA
jgi:predicted alpha/beta superfamily hydrolase